MLVHTFYPIDLIISNENTCFHCFREKSIVPFTFLPNSTMKTNPNDGHRQRLRDKFLKSGIDALHDYEIVELLLTLGTPRSDCKPQAKEAIERFKTLRGVLEADPLELQKIKGIGKNNWFGLKLIRGVTNKYLKSELKKKDALKSSSQVHEYLLHSMRGLKKEVFKVIFLNAQNKILEVEDAFEGSLTSSAVYPREIAKSAISHNAVGLIFAHNHPSGNASPSEEDKSITRQLVRACHTLQINVLDHIIIGENAYYSFADNGLIEEYRNSTESL